MNGKDSRKERKRQKNKHRERGRKGDATCNCQVREGGKQVRTEEMTGAEGI